MLLLTLGSPENTSTAAVRTFLNEFLTDPQVIDIPAIFRHALVRGWIAPLRAPKSAEAYKKIWTDEGSPLIFHTQQFTDKLREKLARNFDVRWAARYGRPSTEYHLKNWDIEELYVVPMYPQYALSSTQTALDRVKQAVKDCGRTIKVRVVKDFFAEPEFIHSQSQQILFSSTKFKPDHYMLSFHGLPVHHVQKLHPLRCQIAPGCCEKVTEANRWCYRAQCMATARALATSLNLSAERVTVSFQSRLGRRPWIEPYTDQIIATLVESGVRRLLVSCPSFVADCLETLEEVQIRLKEQFISLGGTDLKLVPALNSEDFWIEDFSQMVTRQNFKWSSL